MMINSEAVYYRYATGSQDLSDTEHHHRFGGWSGSGCVVSLFTVNEQWSSNR
jgi:hypothetical protein